MDTKTIFEGIKCGDCGGLDPQWTSLNRGILLCQECCFIHRSLGPSYSRIKSIAQSQWNTSLRNMVANLASGSANNIWEHALLDPNIKTEQQIKKIGPKDSFAEKKKFILMKHNQFKFVLKQKIETFAERSEELHSTVRTSDIGTTLRLLASGADPNFFHPAKGTRPLHVAARTGQFLQVELLFIHGAQTDAPDYLGQTPVEHALSAGYKDLAHRLIELRFQLTDQLSYFACSELPDHLLGKHILIPNIENKTINQTEGIIRNMNSLAFEQNISDIYDEIDRRHTEKALSLSAGTENQKWTIEFLPVDPKFSPIRNQNRQKLARLTDEELSILITASLLEAKRRHCNGLPSIESEKDIFTIKPANNSSKSSIEQPAEDDDYPLYDIVASDEDLVYTEKQTLLAQQRAAIEEKSALSTNSSNIQQASNINNSKENETLALKLTESEAKIQELQDSNLDLKSEIIVLQRMIGCLIHENLKHLESQKRQNGQTTILPKLPPIVNGNNPLLGSVSKPPFKYRTSRPVSMFEPKPESKEEENLPIRPSTTEVFLRNSGTHRVNLIQETTRKVVEMIKLIIEYAQTNDLQGVLLSSSKLYETANEMALTLLAMETHEESKKSVENVLFQVLKMKIEIRAIANDFLIPKRKNEKEPFKEMKTVVQKVKQICFDVGAAMKQLVSNTQAPLT